MSSLGAEPANTPMKLAVRKRDGHGDISRSFAVGGAHRTPRYLRVVYVPDLVPDSVFVITAYDIGPKAK